MLRPVTDADADMLLRWRNSPEVARYMYTDHEISPAEHAAWLERALAREDASYFIIRARDTDVGFTSVTDIDLRHGTGTYAIYVGETGARGRGAGAGGTYAVLEYAFGERRLRKVSCEVLATNERALALYERFGFVREGRFREQILKREGPVDVHRLGLLAREWDEVREDHRRRLVEEGILTG